MTRQYLDCRLNVVWQRKKYRFMDAVVATLLLLFYIGSFASCITQQKENAVLHSHVNQLLKLCSLVPARAPTSSSSDTRFTTGTASSVPSSSLEPSAPFSLACFFPAGLDGPSCFCGCGWDKRLGPKVLDCSLFDPMVRNFAAGLRSPSVNSLSTPFILGAFDDLS